MRDIRKNWAKYAEQCSNFCIVSLTKVRDAKISQELTKYLIKFKGDLTPKAICDIASGTKGIRKISASGEFRKKIIEAKADIDAIAKTEREQLANFGYDVEFYKWLCGEYNLIEVDSYANE